MRLLAKEFQKRITRGLFRNYSRRIQTYTQDLPVNHEAWIIPSSLKGGGNPSMLQSTWQAQSSWDDTQEHGEQSHQESKQNLKDLNNWLRKAMKLLPLGVVAFGEMIRESWNAEKARIVLYKAFDNDNQASVEGFLSEELENLDDERAMEYCQKFIFSQEPLYNPNISVKGSYNPTQAQNTVLQGFNGGLNLLFEDMDNNKNDYKTLIENCGEALEKRQEQLQSLCTRYEEEVKLIGKMLNNPSVLTNGARRLGMSSKGYEEKLKKQKETCYENLEAAKYLRSDIKLRVGVHQDLAKDYKQYETSLREIVKIEQDLDNMSKQLGIDKHDLKKWIENTKGALLYRLGLMTGNTCAGLQGHAIKNEYLGKIVDMANKYATNAQSVLSQIDKLKSDDLTDGEKKEIKTNLKNNYEEFSSQMVKDEINLVTASAKDLEFSQAMAHTIAALIKHEGIDGFRAFAKERELAVIMKPDDPVKLLRDTANIPSATKRYFFSIKNFGSLQKAAVMNAKDAEAPDTHDASRPRG